MILLNPANLLTIFRFLASFVFLFFALRKEWDQAFLVFILAASTDLIDGTVARLLKQKTKLGGFLDPAADKCLMFFSFLALTLDRRLPWWLTALVVARDLTIISGVGFLKNRGISIVYQPTYLSKATTFFQIVTVFSILFMSVSFEAYPRLQLEACARLLMTTAPFIIICTAVLTMVTGVQYFWIGRRMLRECPRNASSS